MLVCLVLSAAARAGSAPPEEPPGIPPPIDRPAMKFGAAETMALMGIARADGRLVAVGEAGIVILSDDGGRSWRQVAVPVSVTLTDVTFVDGRRGWVVGHGGVVLGSRDGGETWQRLIDGRAIADMVLADVRARVAEAGDEIPFELEVHKMRAEAAVGRLPIESLFTVHFQNARDGIVAGAFGLILRTQDGGESWQLWRSAIDTDSHLYAIREIDDRLFVVGERGGFYRSNREYTAFESLKPPYDGTYFGIVRLSREGDFVAFGLNGHGVRGKQADDQLRWAGFPKMNGTSLTNGRLLPDGRVALTAVDGTLRISDREGGQFSVVEADSPAPLNDLAVAPDGRIVAVGMGGVRLIDSEVVR